MNTGKNKGSQKDMEKVEAFIFDEDAKGTFANFYSIAEKIGMHYVLYVQAPCGEQPDSVWACQKWQLNDCLEEICNSGYFVNIQQFGHDTFRAKVQLLGNPPIAS